MAANICHAGLSCSLWASRKVFSNRKRLIQKLPKNSLRNLGLVYPQNEGFFLLNSHTKKFTSSAESSPPELLHRRFGTTHSSPKVIETRAGVRCFLVPFPNLWALQPSSSLRYPVELRQHCENLLSLSG